MKNERIRMQKNVQRKDCSFFSYSLQASLVIVFSENNKRKLYNFSLIVLTFPTQCCVIGRIQNAHIFQSLSITFNITFFSIFSLSDFAGLLFIFFFFPIFFNHINVLSTMNTCIHVPYSCIIS